MKPSWPWRLLARFVLACLLTYGLEFWLHRAVEESGESHNVLTQSLFGLASVYHRVVTLSPRKPAPRFTALIKLSEAASPPNIPENLCDQRQFLGELLKSLATAHPNVVLLDKYFGATTCKAEDPGTINLLAGAQALCDNDIAIVVGRVVKEEEREKPEISASYPLRPALRFDPPAACVEEGISNIDQDLRRVDLWWRNVQAVANSPPPPRSVAFAAALAASPNLLASGRLAGWTPESPPPYVSFVERGQFAAHTIAAKDVMCESNEPPGWRACEEHKMKSPIRELIQGRVVVIGEDVAGVDRHKTVVGDLPGYQLQANYVESLLDDRLIRPVPETMNVVVGLLFFAAFEYLAWRYHHRRVKAFVLMFALVAGTGLAIYLSVILLGYYLNPATVGVLAVLLRVADVAFMPPETESGG